MTRKKKYAQVRREALKIMANVYDPFHDQHHAIEVEKTALSIYEQLPAKLKKKADPNIIRLLSVLHDTSREVIGTNMFLEPLMGGYISGWIGYRLMLNAGFSYDEAVYVRGIIRNHESFLGFWKYPMDINGQVFSDADTVETFSLKRLQRGLKYFKQNRFSNILLNTYVAGLILSHIFISPHFYFKISKNLEKENIERLKMFLKTRKKVFEAVLYRHIFKILYSQKVTTIQR